VFLVATWYGLIPWWLTWAAVSRDVPDRIGGAGVSDRLGRAQRAADDSSKINTLLQLLYVLAVVAHAAYGLPSQAWVDALIAPICITLALSGFLYVQEFTHRALEVARA